MKLRRRSIWGLVGWGFLIFLLPALILGATGTSPSAPMVAPLFLSPVPGALGFRMCENRLRRLKQIRRILAAYEWQPVPADTSKRHAAAVKRAFHHFNVPHPEVPEKSVGIIARRSSTLWMGWRRSMDTARSEGFKFAGDPRFGGVIAPGGHPRNLFLVRPRHPFQRTEDRPAEVSETAWESAVVARVAGPFSLVKLKQLDDMERRGSRHA